MIDFLSWKIKVEKIEHKPIQRNKRSMTIGMQIQGKEDVDLKKIRITSNDETL
jgi:hypothetical protein